MQEAEIPCERKTGDTFRPLTREWPDTCLHSASFRCPVRKTLHLKPVLPGQFSELPCVEMFRFFAQKRLKPPAEVRTVPRMKSVATRGNPVINECVPHRSFDSLARSAHRCRQMLVYQQPARTASLPNPGVTDFRFRDFAILRCQ